MRPSGRSADEMRPVRFTTDFARYAEGSVLTEFGNTRVLATASLEHRVPGFLKGRGEGWVTAEYGMLPRSTGERMQREGTRGGISGRTQEIQRLIGRSLRAAVDLYALEERTIWVDCDVIQADGGTRTAAITGAFVALSDACQGLVERKQIKRSPILDNIAATSVGILAGEALLDLCYVEDSTADVDMNVVMTGSGDFIEVQGTAEEKPFSREMYDTMLDLAVDGIGRLVRLQKRMMTENLDEACLGDT